MNKIYGFGNALIDIEIQITEEELKEINIEKGFMKHITRAVSYTHLTLPTILLV